jgi:hypothetical protein
MTLPLPVFFTGGADGIADLLIDIFLLKFI